MICTPVWLFVLVVLILTAPVCLAAFALSGYRHERRAFVSEPKPKRERDPKIVDFPSRRERRED